MGSSLSLIYTFVFMCKVLQSFPLPCLRVARAPHGKHDECIKQTDLYDLQAEVGQPLLFLSLVSTLLHSTKYTCSTRLYVGWHTTGPQVVDSLCRSEQEAILSHLH